MNFKEILTKSLCWLLGHKAKFQWVTFKEGAQSHYKQRLLELGIDGVTKYYCERCALHRDKLFLAESYDLQAGIYRRIERFFRILFISKMNWIRNWHYRKFRHKKVMRDLHDHCTAYLEKKKLEASLT